MAAIGSRRKYSATHIAMSSCSESVSSLRTGDYKGHPMLFARRDHVTLAFACSIPWLARSVGFAGYSDGWRDVSENFRMTWDYTRAENGNIALTGEIDLQACGGEFVLALGFGRDC